MSRAAVIIIAVLGLAGCCAPAPPPAPQPAPPPVASRVDAPPGPLILVELTGLT